MPTPTVHDVLDALERAGLVKAVAALRSWARSSSKSSRPATTTARDGSGWLGPTVRKSRSEAVEELHEQAVDVVGAFLLDPVAAVQEVGRTV